MDSYRRAGQQPPAHLLDKIKAEYAQTNLLSDEELAASTAKLQDRLAKGAALDDLVVEAFGVVREVARRKLNMMHRDQQIRAALALYAGCIVEMDNGEGKTLASVMPIYLHALTKKEVHVSTYNDYLVRRDVLWMGPIYDFLGLSVGLLQQNNQAGRLVRRDDGGYEIVSCTRREAYFCDITYGVYYEYIFDYLKDNMVMDAAEKVHRGFYYMLIDEADSVLIDQSNQDVIISGNLQGPQPNFAFPFKIARALRPDEHFVVHQESLSLYLTEAGIHYIERMIQSPNIYSVEDAGLVHHIIQSLRALYIYRPDRDYFVRNGRIWWIDVDTGRARPWSQSSDGLLQGVELKEGLTPSPMSTIPLNKMTYQVFFKMYQVLAGMSATALWRKQELKRVYGLDAVRIEPHLPSRRLSFEPSGDMVYQNRAGLNRAILGHIEEVHQAGQGRPILVDAIHVDRAEELSRALALKNIAHQLLTAKNDEQEAAIIEQAGQVGQITITAKMAGRGTDIKLSPEAIELGGLHVISTERHPQRHRDMQLQGRAGRQGQPGTYLFFLSLEDNLMQRFGAERVKRIMKWSDLAEDVPITHDVIQASIRRAQRQLENFEAKMRQRVFEYDSVLDKQRRFIFALRDRILAGQGIPASFETMLTNFVSRCGQRWLMGDDKQAPFNERLNQFSAQVIDVCPRVNPNLFSEIASDTPANIVDFTHKHLRAILDRHQQKIGPVYWDLGLARMFLTVVDQGWRKHLRDVNDLRSIAHLQDDALGWYMIECNRAFAAGLEQIERDLLRHMFSCQLTVDSIVSWS